MSEPAFNAPPAPPVELNLSKVPRHKAVVVCLAHGPLPLAIGPQPITFNPGTPTIVDAGLVETLLAIREPKTNRALFQLVRGAVEEKKE